MKKYDIVIIGAGIVGLAAAHKLRSRDPLLKIAVLEKESQVACHQTGHNSGVIHSGVYYTPGSLKAKNCAQGYGQLLSFLEEQNIAYEICGKLIVAVRPQQIKALEGIQARGRANGLSELKMLSSEEILEFEPHVRAAQALRVPQAGIVDFKQVAKSLYHLLANQGVDFYFKAQVSDLYERLSSVHVVTAGLNVECDVVINCAGLYCDQVAEMLQQKLDIRILPFRGEYYELKKQSLHLVKNLIYPVPDSRFPFLGVHFTRMIGGGVEAGPNAVLALRREGYSWADIHLGELMGTLGWPGFYKVAAKYWKVGYSEVMRSVLKSEFTRSLQELIPEIKESDLVSGGSGVRAQACSRDGQLLDDFHIVQGANSIHVLNAPSPAATSCFAIANTISELYFHKVS